MACLLSYLYSYKSLIIIYCLRHLLLCTCKKGCLQTCKYDQFLSIMETYLPVLRVNVQSCSLGIFSQVEKIISMK